MQANFHLYEHPNPANRSLFLTPLLGCRRLSDLLACAERHIPQRSAQKQHHRGVCRSHSFAAQFATLGVNYFASINPLNPELNLIYLLALLGAHHFLHVSRIRVKSLTFRLLMSYIYMEHPFLMFLDHTQRRSTVGRTPLDE